MPQLFAQIASRPSPWLLGRTSAGLCTLQTACPLTVTYSGGSPAADTIAAGSTATVYGGSAATFDASADVWVVLTVPGSGTLQVTKEAELAAVTGDWAGLARVVQHSVEPYQPQAYLSAGGLGGPPVTTTPALSDTSNRIKTLWNGSSNNAPPASWYTTAYDDSAWTAAVVSALSPYTPPSGSSWIWSAAHPAAQTDAVLVRRVVTLGAGALGSATLAVAVDDKLLAVYVNGTAVSGLGLPWDNTGGSATRTADVTALLLPGAANCIALHVQNNSPVPSPNSAGVAYALTVTSTGVGAASDPTTSDGDLIYRSSGGLVRLPIGTSGQELTVVGGDPAWATPAAGTVTSVALAGPTGTTVSGSPITSSGTLTLSWASQSANTFLGAPNGSSGAPTFRVLAAGDIPSLPASQITSGQLAAARGGTGTDGSAAANGTLLIGNGSGYTLATLTAGSGVSITDGAGSITIAASGGGGSGTVTSVALTVPAFLSVSGSPVTTSGTLAVTLATQSANTVLAGPSSGSAAAPTFRALAASDLPAAAAAGGHVHAHGHFR